jgi:addiction module HigA family antidote
MCLEPLNLTVTQGARALGVTRQALSALVNGQAGVSPEMALRLSKAFGSTPRHWFQLQLNYDLWHAEQRSSEIEVRRYELVSA